MPNRRRPWIAIIAAPVLLPVAYLLGFGPAMWLSERSAIVGRPVALFYGPLVDFAYYSDFEAFSMDEPPSRFPALLRWYVRVGTKPGNTPTVARGTVRWIYCPGGSDRRLGELF